MLERPPGAVSSHVPVAVANVEGCRTGDSGAVRAWLSVRAGPVFRNRVSAGRRRLVASRCPVTAIQDGEGAGEPQQDHGERGPGSDGRVAPVDAAGRGGRGLVQLDDGHLRSAEGAAAFGAAGFGDRRSCRAFASIDGSAASRVSGLRRSCCAVDADGWPDGGCSRRRAGGTVGNRPGNGFSASWPTGGG
jgi:hypothetical protein